MLRKLNIIWETMLIMGCLLFLGSSGTAEACNRFRTKNVKMFATYEKDPSGDPTLWRHYGDVEGVSLSGCDRKSAGKYIVIQSSPKFSNLKNQTVGSAYGQFQPDGCEFKNSTLSAQNSTQTGFTEFFLSQRKLITTCVNIVVKDTANPLDYKASQFDCQVTAKDAHTAIARGGHCYFRIGNGSNFEINYEINPDCTKREFLQAQGISPLFMQNLYNVFFSPDDTGHSVNLQYLGVLEGSLLLSPGKDVIPVTDYLGPYSPKWPTIAATEVDIGEVSLGLRQQSNPDAPPSYDIKIPFLVNNSCPSKCTDGICTSPCNFPFPAVAEMTLKKKNSSGNYVISDVWYHGGTAEPGNLTFMDLSHPFPEKPKVGEEYALEARFGSPALSYQMLKTQVQKMLIDYEKSIASGNFNLGNLNKLGSLGGMEISGLSNLSSSNVNSPTNDGDKGPLQAALTALNSRLGSTEWPPYYTKFCNKTGTCIPHNQNYQNIRISFSIGNVDNNGIVTLQNIVRQQKSSLFGTFVHNGSEQPILVCSEIQP